ncbi:hypothetical protein V8D89_009774 [Ganoderma adspersum]
MTPAMSLGEVPSATNSLDVVVADQDHLRLEDEGPSPRELDKGKENVFGSYSYRSANEDNDPFDDSDSDDGDDDNEFVPRGERSLPTHKKAASGPGFVPKKVDTSRSPSDSKTEKDLGAGEEKAEKPKVRTVLSSCEELGCPNGSAQDATKQKKNIKTA